MLELRVGALLVFVAYLFSLDTAVLSRYNIDVSHAFGYRSISTSPQKAANTMLATWTAGSVIFGVQRMIVPSSETRIIPLSTLIVLIAIILKQQRLLRVLQRVVIGRISAENRLGDILVSDALVSMASVFVDIGYAISLTYYGIPASNPVDRPNHIGYKTLLIASIPQGIRAKQCVIDFKRTKDKQHLLNLLKYIIGNFPHALRVQIALLNAGVPEEAILRSSLETLLRKALYVNALYSLCWDLIVDWKMGRLLHTPAVLRFPKTWYYTAIIADTMLRFSFITSIPVEHVIFTLQALELLRRGMWVLFRIESEPMELTEDIELASSGAQVQ